MIRWNLRRSSRYRSLYRPSWVYPPFKLKRKAGCRSVAAPCRFQALRALGFGVILCVHVRIALGGLAALDAVSGRAACGNQEDADGDGDVRHVNAGLSVGGACRGRGDGHGLSLVVDILMLRYGNVSGLAVDIALFGQLLEDNQCMTVEGGCIELAEVE